MIKVILGSFGAFRFLKICISKMAGRRANGLKFGLWGLSIQWTQGTFDTQVLKVILGLFGVFLIFRKPCVSKTADFRVKDTSRSLCYPGYVAIVFHLVKQSAKPLGFLFITDINTNHPLVFIFMSPASSYCFNITHR